MDRRAWWATVHGVTKSRIPFPQASIQTEFLPFLHTRLPDKIQDTQGNSLVVQGLRLQTSKAGVVGLISSHRTKIP